METIYSYVATSCQSCFFNKRKYALFTYISISYIIVCHGNVSLNHISLLGPNVLQQQKIAPITTFFAKIVDTCRRSLANSSLVSLEALPVAVEW